MAMMRNETTIPATPTADEAPTTPAVASQPATTRDRSAAREDIARAILATLAPRDRREVYATTRRFLRAVAGAHEVAAWHMDIADALDRGSATAAMEHARTALDCLAAGILNTPHRAAVNALCAAVADADVIGAGRDVGVYDGRGEVRRMLRAMRELRRAYQSAQRGARS